MIAIARSRIRIPERVLLRCWRSSSSTIAVQSTSLLSGLPASQGTRNLSYFEEKKAAKDRRRELYEERQARKERVKNRRKGKPRHVKKNEFKNWFKPLRANQEVMDRRARQAGLDWQIKVAAVLERLPVVLPDPEPWETEMDELQAHLNKYGKLYTEEIIGDLEKHEFITKNEELLELLPFTPAPRETEADASGDVQTLNRKLKTFIYLAVKDKEDSNWHFPTVELKDEESLIDGAKRAIADQLGSHVEYFSASNSPMAVDLQPFPEEERTQFYGVKTFFMMIQHDEGDVTSKQGKFDDFGWFDRVEMVQHVEKERGESLKRFYHYLLRD